MHFLGFFVLSPSLRSYFPGKQKNHQLPQTKIFANVNIQALHENKQGCIFSMHIQNPFWVISNNFAGVSHQKRLVSFAKHKCWSQTATATHVAYFGQTNAIAIFIWKDYMLVLTGFELLQNFLS